MRCSSCGRDSEFDSAYCRYCGTSFATGERAARRLTRRPLNGQVAGVCAGIAAHFQIDVTIVRILWIVLSIVPGAVIGGLIAYIAAWLVMPEGSEAIGENAPVQRLFRSEHNRKVAGVCGGLAEYLKVDATLVRLAFVVLSIYPGAVICGVLAYLLALIIIPLAPPTSFETAPVT